MIKSGPHIIDTLETGEFALDGGAMVTLNDKGYAVPTLVTF